MSERLIGYAQVSNSLPGSWRPFSAVDAIWNTRIFLEGDASFAPVDWDVSEDSGAQIAKAASLSTNQKLQFSEVNNIPLWNITGLVLPQMRGHSSSNIYVDWDANMDDCTDVLIPYQEGMWWEGWPATSGDRHIVLIDLLANRAWEMSRFRYPDPSPICGTDPGVQHSTFNIWDLSGLGYHPTQPWSVPAPHGATSRGGRGGGTPCFTGLIRPEEVFAGEVLHALCFTYSGLRAHASGDKLYLHPPCCRSDSDNDDIPDDQTGAEWMVYGTRIQLDPSKTTADFQALPSGGITNTYTHRVLRALQNYGAYCVDYGGGGIKMQRQMLDYNNTTDRAMWNSYLPGPSGHLFLEEFKKIPISWFRVLSSDLQTQIVWNP